jgi:glutamate synthase (NADPH/NADH) large chain
MAHRLPSIEAKAIAMDKLNVSHAPGWPSAQGMYDPRNEKDACGIGFVAHIKGQKSHDILRKGLQVLDNLTHRGAQGCDPCTGDGAGVLSQIPHEFFQRICGEVGIRLPAAGAYGVGMVFLPQDVKAGNNVRHCLSRLFRKKGKNF